MQTLKRLNILAQFDHTKSVHLSSTLYIWNYTLHRKLNEHELKYDNKYDPIKTSSIMCVSSTLYIKE